MAERFHKGDRLEMTEEGRRVLLGMSRTETGVVVLEPRNLELVTVRKDGQKSASRYHVDFWRKVNG